MKSILKKTFIYKRLYRPYMDKKNNDAKRRKIESFLNGGLLLLEDFTKIMNQHNITYWLDFGTLLGAYRDKKFIKGDCDLDFGAMLHDAKQIYDLLTSNGFRLVREFHVRGENGLEQTYAKYNTTLDVFYFREEGDYMYCNGFYDAIDRKIGQYFVIHVIEAKFNKFRTCKMDFLGLEVNVPSNAGDHLKEHYGPNFMVYDPYFKQPYNSVKYTLSEKVGCGYFLE